MREDRLRCTTKCTTRPLVDPENRFKCGLDESGRQDLNLRPPGPEPGALPG
jgi:hypothetical protein